MADFDGIIDPAAEWADIPQLSVDAVALGGAGGAMNAQALAIAKRLKILDNKSVSVTRFGAAADWNGVDGTNNTDKFLDAFEYIKLIGGGTLYVPPGDYYFGSFSTSAIVMSISGLLNCMISAYGARFICNTSASGATPFLFYFLNPNNVVLAGARFFDSGFDMASWSSHSRWGMAAVCLNATVDSKRFKMIDCEGENITYFLVSDLRANKRKLTDVSVVDCRVKNAYYGVDMIYAGDNLKIDNFICEDVRRGYIGYGTRNADIDIKLRTSSGFLGSNAFISLGCEGETYNDIAVGGSGVIGADANVENVRIKLNVSGYEAHENYVHLYHQQADGAGHIKNVDADVKVNNLSAAGKNAGLGNTNVFMFDHELPDTTIAGSTTRNFKQINLSGGIIGAITGLPVVISSVNGADRHTISLSPSISELAATLVVGALTTGINWLSPFERPLPTLIPVGATSEGVVTGLASEGTMTTVGKRVFFNAKLSWTGHTGTGQLRINGLPLAANVVAPSVANPAITIIDSGVPHTAGTTLVAMIGGASNSQILIYEETNGTLDNATVDAVVSGLYISGSYLSA